MKRLPLALLLLLAVAMAPALDAGPASFPVIVVFDDAADLAPLAAYYVPDQRAAADPGAWSYQHRGVLGAVQALEDAHGFRARFVYGAAIRGFAARLSARQIADLEDDPAIAFVEPDGEMRALAQTLPWGVNRVDADLSSTLAGNGSGAVNVNLYVLDTGIDTAHADLRVVGHVTFAGTPNSDCNGHGTQVSGTAAARDNTIDVVGVAPGARLTGVKVLNCSGAGSTSGVIAGVDWVTANRVLPAVANMSLGGNPSTALDNAVRNSVARGVFYAVAAGASAGDACNVSPARAGAGTNNGILTVAATDMNNNEASFSNFGPCVDIWAPGVSILTTRSGGGTVTLSGTSLAAAHGSGGGALYLSTHAGATPATIESAIRAAAVLPGTKSKNGAPIRLLNVRTF